MDILRRNPPDASFGSGNNNPQGACTTPSARRPLDHRGTDTVVFHDPLAVAVPFAPELVTWQRVHLGVELCEAGRFGRTYAREDGRWPHAIACESDPTAFFRHYYALAGLSPP